MDNSVNQYRACSVQQMIASSSFDFKWKKRQIESWSSKMWKIYKKAINPHKVVYIDKNSMSKYSRKWIVSILLSKWVKQNINPCEGQKRKSVWAGKTISHLEGERKKRKTRNFFGYRILVSGAHCSSQLASHLMVMAEVPKSLWCSSLASSA